eukprot:4191768-Heterocapsa_arctica.AAC.1
MAQPKAVPPEPPGCASGGNDPSRWRPSLGSNWKLNLETGTYVDRNAQNFQQRWDTTGQQGWSPWDAQKREEGQAGDGQQEGPQAAWPLEPANMPEANAWSDPQQPDPGPHRREGQA